MKKLITGVIYSQFNEKVGPQAIAWYPEELPRKIQNLISLKTVAIMMGEDKSITKSLAILPFPSINLKGLVKLMEIDDESKRGGVIESSITLLFDEKYDSIFYKYIDSFNDIFNEITQKIIELKAVSEDTQIGEILKYFYNSTINLLQELQNRDGSNEEQVAFPKSEEEITKGILRFKIIIVGDPMVGKTSIILRFTDRAFKKIYISTIGVNITEKKMTYRDNKIEFILWDIAGQSKFQMMRKHFYKGANAQILVFDLTAPKTFKNISKWNLDIKRYIEHDIPGILLGNKKDLEDQRKVTKEEGLKLAQEIGFEYIETSALAGENIDEAFYKLIDILCN